MPNGDNQPVTGPDGKTYQFPSGTTKEQAIAYFKAKGIGMPAKKETAEAPHYGFSTGDYQRAGAMDQSKVPSYFTPASPTGISTDPQHTRTEATQLAAGVGGAGMGMFLNSLKGGGVVLPKIVQMLYRSAATGVGAAAGAAATGAGPGESLKTGAQYGGAEFGGEAMFGAAGAAFTLFRRMFGADPKRLTDLGELIETEEKVRDTVQKSAPQIRQSINASYPSVDTKVRIMPAAKVAQKAEGAMVAEAAPKQVSRVADIGRARQQQALRLLSRAARIMQNSPEGASDEVSAILAKAKDLQGIDFMDAQKLYSALGRAAASGHGYKLPGEQIFALKEARDALESSMHDALRFDSAMQRTAKAAGVMPEGELGDFYRFRDSQTGGSFSVRKSEYSAAKVGEEANKLRRAIPDTTKLDPLAQQKLQDVRQRFQSWQPADKLSQWEKAQAAHKQFIDDFYETGGALTAVMKAAPEERGEVLKHLLSKPDTRIRATKALARYGFDTEAVLRLAAKWRDPTELNRAIADAARLEQVGQDIFSQQEGAAVRRTVGKHIVKKGLVGLTGLAGYEIWKAFQSKSPSLFRTQP